MTKHLKKVAHIIIKITIVCLLVLSFLLLNRRINMIRKQKIDIVDDTGDVCYQFENVYDNGKEVVIDGWFFSLKSVQNVEREVNDVQEDVSILLIDVTTNEVGEKYGILSEVTWQERQDVNKYFACNYDYSRSGFSACFKKSILNLEEKKYQLVIKNSKTSSSAIATNTFLVDGKLTRFLPGSIMSLDVVGTDLEQIVNEGNCIASQPQYHCSIFQYKNCLYWITDEGFTFEEDGNTIMEYAIATTQFERLPSEETDIGRFWDNCGASFEQYEITEQMDCGKYRVSAREMPSEYSIVHFALGYRKNDNWIWYSFARPYYDFKLFDESGC